MLAKIIELIKKHDIITIFRHVLPDGDAFGSQFGLQEMIKTTFPDKQVYTFGENASGRFAKIFPASNPCSEELIKKSLAIVLDTSNKERIDDQRCFLARQLIKIDHHPDVQVYGDYQEVNTAVCACAEQMVMLMLEAGWQTSTVGASYLYTGMVTDSGRFAYGNITPNTYRCLSALAEYRFKAPTILAALQTQTVADTKLKGYILNNYQINDGGTATLVLSIDFLATLNLDQNAATAVNTLSGIEGINGWLLIGQGTDCYRAELRSSGMPVNVIAARHGGGGHRQAAGARLTTKEEVDALIADFISAGQRYSMYLTALKAAQGAATAVMEYYQHDYQVQIKDDDSPVTEADLKSNEIILNVIKEAYPGHDILSEETVDDTNRLTRSQLWIIDPIDGTMDFINKTDQFAINIAYAEQGQLQFGLVAVPALDEIYFAFAGHGAFKSKLSDPTEWIPLQVKLNPEKIRVARSRHHQRADEELLLDKHAALIGEVKDVGSSYKLCLVAAGAVDLVFKSGAGTKEWDVAAPDIIIKEAGGAFVDGKGIPFSYNRADVANRNGYIAVGDPVLLKLFK